MGGSQVEKMDPLRAMILLTKACMNYMYVSAGYRSMAYYAGWAWLKEFNKTDHPLTAQTRDMAFLRGHAADMYGLFAGRI